MARQVRPGSTSARSRATPPSWAPRPSRLSAPGGGPSQASPGSRWRAPSSCSWRRERCWCAGLCASISPGPPCRPRHSLSARATLRSWGCPCSSCSLARRRAHGRGRAPAGIELVRGHGEDARSAGLYPADPIFPWFGEEITSPAVVLAKDLPSARIPAYSSEANVVSRRGSLVLQVLPALEQRAPGRIEVPQGALDVQEFFRGTTFARKVEILRRHQVDYVMIQSGSRLNRTLGTLPGFERMDDPSERYDVYHVDLRRLDLLPPQ